MKRQRFFYIIILASMTFFLMSNCASPTDEVERRNEPSTTPSLLPTLTPSLTLEPVQATPTEILLTESPLNLMPKFDDMLPESMILGPHKIKSNDDEFADHPAPGFLQKLEDWGRIESYYEIYWQADRCKSESGIYEVKVEITAFKSESGAEAYRKWHLTEGAPVDVPHQETTKAFGDSAQLFQWLDDSDCFPGNRITRESASFRRYNMDVYVGVATYKDMENTNDMKALTIQLAQLVDSALKDAAH